MCRNKYTTLIFGLVNSAYRINNLHNRPFVLYHHNLNKTAGFLYNGLYTYNKRHIERLYSKSLTDSLNGNCVSDILKKWSITFEENSILEPKESIQFIVCHLLKIERISDIYKKEWLEHSLTQAEINNINYMCQKRMKSCPIQYILEEWTFRDLTLKMKPPVFIPRPETEELVEIVKNGILLTGVKNILEICCGSGAICLSLLKEIPNISVFAVDKSKEACFLTAKNAHKNNISNRLTVVQHDITLEEENIRLFAEKHNYYDIIVSNPPYVPNRDMKGLQRDILLYEDLSALDGGLDGLDIIKPILRLSSVILRPGGRLYLEVDPSHPDLIHALLHFNSQGSDSTPELTKRYKDEKPDGIKNQGQLQDCLYEFNNLGLRIRNIHEDFNQKKRFVELIKIV